MFKQEVLDCTHLCDKLHYKLNDICTCTNYKILFIGSVKKKVSDFLPLGMNHDQKNDFGTLTDCCYKFLLDDEKGEYAWNNCFMHSL